MRVPLGETGPHLLAPQKWGQKKSTKVWYNKKINFSFSQRREKNLSFLKKSKHSMCLREREMNLYKNTL